MAANMICSFMIVWRLLIQIPWLRELVPWVVIPTQGMWKTSSTIPSSSSRMSLLEIHLQCILPIKQSILCALFASIPDFLLTTSRNIWPTDHCHDGRLLVGYFNTNTCNVGGTFIKLHHWQKHIICKFIQFTNKGEEKKPEESTKWDDACKDKLRELIDEKLINPIDTISAKIKPYYSSKTVFAQACHKIFCTHHLLGLTLHRQ